MDMDRTVPIDGWGADIAPENRPGVPMEVVPPGEKEPGEQLWRQVPRVTVLKRANLPALTPVFGTAQPPKGASGVLRRVGYKIPEHFTSHWAVLLLADRVDIVESAVSDLVRRRPLGATFAILGFGAFGFGLKRVLS